MFRETSERKKEKQQEVRKMYLFMPSNLCRKCAMILLYFITSDEVKIRSLFNIERGKGIIFFFFKEL